MVDAIGDAKGIDLNSASAEELDRVGGLGEDRVHRLIQGRPFRSWEDVRRIEGFGDRLTEDLKKAGATIGNEE